MGRTVSPTTKNDVSTIYFALWNLVQLWRESWPTNTSAYGFQIEHAYNSKQPWAPTVDAAGRMTAESVHTSTLPSKRSITTTYCYSQLYVSCILVSERSWSSEQGRFLWLSWFFMILLQQTIEILSATTIANSPTKKENQMESGEKSAGNWEGETRMRIVDKQY